LWQLFQQRLEIAIRIYDFGGVVRAYISIPLAILFVFLAGFNVWNMLTGRGSSTGHAKLWIQLHRSAGYAFVSLFAVFCYFMLQRIKGWTDELSPRLIVHMGMALILAPLLLAKIVAARFQKAARGLLMALGITIFAIAFTLVALNLFIHYLRAASTNKAPFGMSLVFVAVVLIATVIAFSAKGRQPASKPEMAALALAQPGRQMPAGRGLAFTLTLARIEAQAPDAKTLRLLLPGDQQIDSRPGQFLTFEWMIEGKPVTRSYSICSSPLQRGYVEITPKRVHNGCVSQFLNDRATVGLTVKARGPYGKFCFDETKHKRIVLLAGGSGITPLMAMLRYIDDLCIPTEATLIYCVRTQEDIFFKEQLAALQRRISGFRYVLVLSKPDAEWSGWKGRLRREILEQEVRHTSELTFFLCGPPAFMELGRTLLADMHIEPSRILQESFGGAVAAEKGSSSTGGSLEITFSRSAVAYKISPEQTLLESSERNGVLIPSGCRQGVCGTCATRLLSGKVQMDREEALNEELRSRGFILPCVSRPLCDVTLDA
jgi:ferredoxin-NADP reductase